LDALNDRDREQALEQLVGTSEPRPGHPQQSRYQHRAVTFEDEDVRLFREYAKEVEEQIGNVEKKEQRERLGLDWDPEE